MDKYDTPFYFGILDSTHINELNIKYKHITNYKNGSYFLAPDGFLINNGVERPYGINIETDKPRIGDTFRISINFKTNIFKTYKNKQMIGNRNNSIRIDPTKSYVIILSTKNMKDEFDIISDMKPANHNSLKNLKFNVPWNVTQYELTKMMSK